MKETFNPSDKFTKDTGLVLVLLLLLAAYLSKEWLYVLLAAGVLLVVMIWPGILRPLAIAWHYFGFALGKIVNPLILGVIFIGLLTPVGLIRRALRYDPMKRKLWKKGEDSVFNVRNHTYSPDDLLKPY